MHFTEVDATGFQAGFYSRPIREMPKAQHTRVLAELPEGTVSATHGLKADPEKFEAESATNETHKWVAPDGP